MTLILFSAPFSSHIRTHQGVTGNGTSLCVWEKQTINLHPHNTHTQTHRDNLSILVEPHRPVLPPSAAPLTHAEGEGERVRDFLADTGVHKDVWGNKQADVSNEAGGFEHSEGIWVMPSDVSLTGRLSCFDHRHRWRWLMKWEGCGLSEVLRFRPRGVVSKAKLG